MATIASCPFLPLDGWRAQVHIEAGAATLYSNNGADITRRFRSLRPALARVPVRSAIIDCELVACDETGMPSFRSLMNLGNKAPALCLWCFDLLSLDGARITPLPLVERRALLGKIVTAASTRHLQFSGEFDDPVALLDTCQRMNLDLEAERLRLPTGADWHWNRSGLLSVLQTPQVAYSADDLTPHV